VSDALPPVATRSTEPTCVVSSPLLPAVETAPHPHTVGIAGAGISRPLLLDAEGAALAGAEREELRLQGRVGLDLFDEIQHAAGRPLHLLGRRQGVRVAGVDDAVQAGGREILGRLGIPLLVEFDGDQLAAVLLDLVVNELPSGGSMASPREKPFRMP
jgi:hypothetical protein